MIAISVGREGRGRGGGGGGAAVVGLQISGRKRGQLGRGPARGAFDINIYVCTKLINIYVCTILTQLGRVRCCINWTIASVSVRHKRF